MKREKRVKTPDDWHPTAADGTVTVMIYKNIAKGPKRWHVSVWGEDYIGMESGRLDINEAFALYRGIRDGVTQEWLRKRGFEYARV